MSGEDIRRYRAQELRLMRERGESLTDWARVDAKTEEELEAVGEDSAVADWFTQRDEDYQVRINEVPRARIHEHSEG